MMSDTTETKAIRYTHTPLAQSQRTEKTKRSKMRGENRMVEKKK